MSNLLSNPLSFLLNKEDLFSKKKKKNLRACMVPVFENDSRELLLKTQRTPKRCYLKTLICSLNLVFFMFFRKKTH